MLLKGCSVPVALRRRAVTIPLALLVMLAVYASTDNHLSLPELDELTTKPQIPVSENAEYCNKRFTAAYLEDLRDHAMQYCEPVNGKMPTSRLTCFHAHVRDDKKADSFCFGTGATWDPGAKRFRLDCPVIHKPDANETAAGLESFDSLTTSWFKTGPKQVFDYFVSLTQNETPQSEKSSLWPNKLPQQESFVILVKREGNNNLWHSLMEIWSMMNSVDVLRMANHQDGSHRGHTFFETPNYLDNTYVVMLDDYPEESTFDLWRYFAPGNPIVKLQDMIDYHVKVPAPLLVPGGKVNIIVPMSGASNPLWQNDWFVKDCNNAPLLKLLVRRVFEHHHVPFAIGPRPIAGGNEKDITVTFIDRRGTRQLVNHEPLFEKLQGRYPNVIIDKVDFATLSLRDQLRLVQDTDILVGVHGAGLTHTMFMREGAGAVVEIQPENLGHKGFRNLAAMMGHKYFSAQAEMVVTGDEEEKKEKEEGHKGTETTPRKKTAS
ncbi:hypothetical protein Sste5346_008861 [Sporothrix stenoceras]|uniref:EGF domain-specific O-linked N-acetylglucosamine transferase n=1 Tax=Sporothrix stenoceras TaxID=5173 RepID=A0ABR3YNM0_9PEZI